MTKTAEHPRSSQEVMERRHHPREKIQEVIYIDLMDGRNGGVVLNISETGLLLQSALKVTDEVVTRLRFRLPASDRWIESRARLVWLGESGKEAGVQFLELSENDRAGIAEWVARGGLPKFPSPIPEEKTASPQTVHEQLAPSIPATGSPHDVAAPVPDAAQLQPGAPLPSFARPQRTTKLSWRGLGLVVTAVAIVAVLLGLKYSPRLPRLPIFDASRPATNAPAKTVPSPPATAGSNRTAPTEAPLHGLPRNPYERGVAPASSTGGESSPAPHAPKTTDSAFGSTVTQTLSNRSSAAEHHAGGIRAETRTRKQPRAASGIESSDTLFPLPAVAPSSSHDIILVGAPAVGSPPARVILETEPVSASANVAVTSSRSILVPAAEHPTEKLHLGKLVSYVSPAYPADVRAKGIEGTVRVRAFIGPSGNVQTVRLLSGPPALAPSAMNAIRKWRFGSTLLNGQPIESQADVTVFFRLH